MSFFGYVAKSLCKINLLDKSPSLQRFLLLHGLINTRLPYYAFKVYIKQLFVDYFAVSSRWWRKDRRDIFIHDKEIFKSRLALATNGILDGLSMNNIVLGGGSVVTLLTKDSEITNSPFDLDLFITRSPFIMDDIKRCLIHFENVGKSRNVQVHFVIRGMLIEVLIPNERRVQIICCKYKSPEETLYCVDLSYVQIFWNGETVHGSYLAMHALKSGFTSSAKVPLKKVRLHKTQNKGFNLRPPYCITELDDNYTDLLGRIDTLKVDMDTFSMRQIIDNSLNMFYTASDTFNAFNIQMNYRWHVLRWLHHAQHYIITDMDIFDQNMRLFSYIKHQPLLQTKKIKSPENVKTQVIGHYIDNNEFNTVVFITHSMKILDIDRSHVTVKSNDEMHTFIDKVITNTGLAQKVQFIALESDEEYPNIEMTIDTHGTRFYDEAERPIDVSNIGEYTNSSMSFVILADETHVWFEVVDMFLT